MKLFDTVSTLQVYVSNNTDYFQPQWIGSAVRAMTHIVRPRLNKGPPCSRRYVGGALSSTDTSSVDITVLCLVLFPGKAALETAVLRTGTECLVEMELRSPHGPETSKLRNMPSASLPTELSDVSQAFPPPDSSFEHEERYLCSFKWSLNTINASLLGSYQHQATCAAASISGSEYLRNRHEWRP
jgi:hypothetical protein